MAVGRRVLNRLPHATQTRRRAAVTFEVILVLPILIVLLCAVVEFGLILANRKHMEQAAYSGANVAAQLSPGELSSGLDAVGDAVQRTLASAKLGSPCRIDLEHNVEGAANPIQIAGECARELPDGQLPAAEGVQAVRVTVWMPYTRLAPDLLWGFGFSLQNRFTRATMTLPHVH